MEHRRDKSLGSGDLQGAKNHLAITASGMANTAVSAIDAQRNIGADLGNQLKQDYQNFIAPTSDPISKPSGGASGGEGNLTAIAKARLAFLKAQSDNELALIKTRNQLEQQQNDRDYKDGLVSLEDYYDKREQLAKDEAAAELKNLQTKLDLAKKEPADDTASQIKKREQIAAIETQIAEKKLQSEAALKALEDERHNAEIQHNIQVLELREQIASKEGDRWKAAELALDAEIAKTEELLTKQGVAAGEIADILQKIRDQGTAKIGFDKASEAGQLSMSDLDLAKRDIQRQADQGQISQIEAQGRIIQLEEQRLADLKEIGKQLTDNAQKSGDPKLIEQAKQYNASVKDIEASLKAVGKAAVELTNQLVSQGMSALTTFFTAALTQTKSFKDAWADLGKAFEQIVANMVARLITFYLMLLLLKAINPTAAKALEAQGPFGKGFAKGGYTGDGGVGDIAGYVHGKEFVMTADATSKYRPLLEMLNGGTPAIASSMGGYASGGFVSPNSGSPFEVNIDTGGQPAQTTERTGSDGKRILDVVIGQIAADVRSGGQVAQAMQQTYGIKRGGVKRG